MTRLLFFFLNKDDKVSSKNDKLSNMINEFKSSISNLNQNENEIILNIMIQNDNISGRYNIINFPQILFFRNGRHVSFNSLLNF
jgi:hypothetical protein